MCWKKKTQSDDAKVKEVLQQAKLDTLINALQDVLKMDYKTQPATEGAAVVTDWEMTVRMTRTRARMALDVITSMETKTEENIEKK